MRSFVVSVRIDYPDRFDGTALDVAGVVDAALKDIPQCHHDPGRGFICDACLGQDGPEVHAAVATDRKATP